MRKEYCEKCNKKVDIDIIENVSKSHQIKGKTYEYIGKKAVCSECGCEVINLDISDYNLKLLNDVYRKENDIITVDEIKILTKKYNIGKRPLSRLLGFADKTITRYIESDMPTKPYSDKLKEILESPKKYLEILEENKERISKVTYEKSKKAATGLFTVEVNTEDEDVKKLLDISLYIISKGDEITNMALQKLLYYVQGFSFALSDKPIYTCDSQAWVAGPVYKEVYSQYKMFGKDPIVLDDEYFALIDITKEEKDIIDSVLKYFGGFTAFRLSEFTHLEEPWQVARNNLLEDEPSNEILNKEVITKYFKEEALNLDIKKASDIGKYAGYINTKYLSIA